MIWGIALAAAAAQDPLTVEQAVQIALDNAFAVRLAESVAEQARANQSAAAGALRPQLNAQGQYVRLAEGVSFGTGGGGGFGGSTSDSKQVNLVLSQIIDISGVTRKTVEARRYQRLASEMDVEAQVNETKSLVRSQFYAVLQAEALVLVQEEELRSVRGRLQNARVREAAGDIARFDVLRLETDEKRSEQALLDAQRNFELAKQDLNLLLGRPVETNFDPVEVSDLPEVGLVPDQAAAIAQENRPELKSGAYLVRAADSLVDVEAGGLKPTLSASAQYSRSIDPPPGQTVQSLFGVFTLSVPVFDGGITRARVRAAREFEEQATLRLEQARLSVSSDVRAALTRLETARKAHETALAGLALARESLRLAGLRYDEQAGILLDVTTAQAELTRAEGAVVTARYQYLTAVAALQRALGTDDLDASTQGGQLK